MTADQPQRVEPQALPTPALHDLDRAVAEAGRHFTAVAAAAAGSSTNHEGADAAKSGSARLLRAHVSNYLVAYELARATGVTGALVDVGAGVGALSSWLAARLEVPWHLVEPNPAVRQVATTSFPDAVTHGALDDVPTSCAGLVTAMEVIEHVPYTAQPRFVQQLLRVLAPGGLLILSTPDESRYPGGWSGYRPHVGVLDARRLADLLRAQSGMRAQVWRLEGGPFELSFTRRISEPVVNRVWATAERLVPRAVERAHHLIANRLPAANHDASGDGHGQDIRAIAADAGRGTGLIAALRAPQPG